MGRPIFTCFNTNLLGQATERKPVEVKSQRMTDEDIREIKQHQFYLDKPGVSIELLEYDKDKQPIRGEITGDGMRVIMNDYVKRGRIRAVIVFEDGTQEEVFKSSCFIDPVIPLWSHLDAD